MGLSTKPISVQGNCCLVIAQAVISKTMLPRWTRPTWLETKLVFPTEHSATPSGLLVSETYDRDYSRFAGVLDVRSTAIPKPHSSGTLIFRINLFGNFPDAEIETLVPNLQRSGRPLAFFRGVLFGRFFHIVKDHDLLPDLIREPRRQ